MAQESGRLEKRIDIGYFEGVNTAVGFNISKKTELAHMENARSKLIGTIEKREGQTVVGKSTTGKPFVTINNFGLFQFTPNGQPNRLYRISAAEDPNISISVSDNLWVNDVNSVGSYTSAYKIQVSESITLSERINDMDFGAATIYYLNGSTEWIPLTTGATGLSGNRFSKTYAEGCIFLTNYNNENRYIEPDGVTVKTASDVGHLFNSPRASLINYYKGRLYLGDYNKFGIRYKTSVLRSLYPSGLISLVNEDIPNADFASNMFIGVTDSKYFYSSTDAQIIANDPSIQFSKYEVYRSNAKIADITVGMVLPPDRIKLSGVSAFSFQSGYSTFEVGDEIWLKNTYSGTKLFLWSNNPTINGVDVKQYDSFKIPGGDDDEITMMTNIGNVMLIANRNSLVSWNDYTLENFDLDIGNVSKTGFVKTLGTLYFLHYTGVYSTSGSVPTLISSKVDRYIKGATTLGKEASAAGKKDRSIFFTLGDVTLYNPDGSVEKIMQDVCIEYNMIQQNWFVHTNVKASEFATFIEDTNSDRLEFTDTAGNKSVKEMLSGESDDGKEIPFRIDPFKFLLQPEYENINNVTTLIIESERGSSMQAYIKTDGDKDYYPIEGKITKGLSIVKLNSKDPNRIKPPATRNISVSLRDSSKQLCKITRMSIIYTPTPAYQSDNE